MQLNTEALTDMPQVTVVEREEHVEIMSNSTQKQVSN